MFNANLNNVLFKHIAWIYDFSTRNNLSLLDYIHNAENALNIEGNYRINIEDKEELKITEDILEHFKEHILNLYFSEKLSLNKSILYFSHKEYFMCKLCDYLLNNQFNQHLNNHNMFTVSEYVPLGQYGTTFFQAKYVFTAYSRIFYKILLITQKFCELNDKTNSLYHFHNEYKNTEQALDAGFVEVERYE